MSTFCSNVLFLRGCADLTTPHSTKPAPYSSQNIIRGDQMGKGEVGGTCGTHRKDDKCIHIVACKAWIEESVYET
jgi:hypothetical protein